MQIVAFPFAVCVPVNVHSCTFASVKSKNMLDKDHLIERIHRKIGLKIRNYKGADLDFLQCFQWRRKKNGDKNNKKEFISE